MFLDLGLPTLIGPVAVMAHVAIAALVTVHILLYKRNVAASVSWIGIAWLSPFLGALLYVTMGINRVKRRAQRLRRQRLPMAIAEETLADAAAKDPLTPLEFAIGRLTGLPSEPGNRIEVLHSGDQAYPRMLAAIAAAEKSVGLLSYIFRADKAGEAFHQALIQAQRRGVEVRVLIDGVGGGYFCSGTYNHLSRAGVPVARFLHSYFPWRMPFVNLRNHRKVLVVDGRIGFTGGLNIGAENISADKPPFVVLDTHFQLEGPIVEQLTDAFADDWLYTTGEKLLTENWFPPLENGGPGAGACRHLRSRRGHGADRVRGAPRHLVRAKVGARGHALFPAARPADHGAGTGGYARHQGRHRPARPFQPRPARLGAAHPASAADRGGLPRLADGAALRSFQADGDRRRLGDGRQRQLGHAQLSPQLRAQCRAARSRLRASKWPRSRPLRAASRWPSSTPTRCRSGCATARHGCCSRICSVLLFLPRHTGRAGRGEPPRDLENFRSEMGGNFAEPSPPGLPV